MNRLPEVTRPACRAIAAGLLLCGMALPAARAQDAPEKKTPPVESGIQEKIQVVLIEFKLLVTDKAGRPVTDLRPEEVKVLENGDVQELAFVESWLTVRSDSALGLEGSVAATAYSPTGEEVRPGHVAEVPPPKPSRRIMMAFDVRNSRIRIREEWRKAATTWVNTHMGPDDLVSVIVVRNYPEWVLSGSSDRQTVLTALERMDLFTDTPDRSRRENVSELVGDLQTNCITSGSGPRRGGGSSDATSVGDLTEETNCAFGIARPYVDQWGNESDESILALRQLTGQLAAVPGRKAVILFSEGIIPDPSELALNAMLSIWGSAIVNFRQLGSSLKRDAYGDLTELQRVARAGDVVFFTFDTRPNSERGYSNEIESQISQARGALGVNPWGEMYEATRSTLSTLAWTTGGRPYYGDQKIAENLETATTGFYGVYNVGYYRSDPLHPGEPKVKITRKDVRFDVPKEIDFRKHEARRTAVELSVGRPVPGAAAGLQLPVAVMTLYDLLPLRRGAGGRGCQLGIFLQAQRRDGTVAAEVFETAIVTVEAKTEEGLRGKYYDHRTALEISPGQYRLRARVSDEMNAIVGDTFLDLTIGEDAIAPGFVEIAPKEPAPPPAG